MAVGGADHDARSGSPGGRRFRVGSNVLLATLLVVAIVAVAQLIAYKSHRRWDWTSTGVNSLSGGTENLLRELDTNVRLTSLYFETDRENEDQSRYRRTTTDLLGLYEATQRSKVRADWINPLKDHEGMSELLARLREKTVFKEQIDTYAQRLESYTNGLDTTMQGLVRSELDKLAALGGGLRESGGRQVLEQIEQAISRLSQTLTNARKQVDSAMLDDNPQYSLAVNVLRPLYTQFAGSLENIGSFASNAAIGTPGLSQQETEFLREAQNRYIEAVAPVQAETTKLQDLKPLKYDDLALQLIPTGNAILVETDDDARVVDFTSCWPPIREGGSGSFYNRAFKGEEKLTSAILRVTHKEQTAVVFVRYGGQSLFLSMMMQGQPPAPYITMKQQLEDTNFIVEEWDLKISQTPPTIEPEPTRLIYVVLKPTAPRRGPMGMPSQEPPFTDSHRQALLSAVESGGRALFIAGWYPGPFGPIPSTYEYNVYLKKDWGIEVDTSALLVRMANIAPGKYAATQGFHILADVETGEHDIVSGALARALGLPMSAPLTLTDPPEGTKVSRLVTAPQRDGLWGIRNLQKYREQSTKQNHLVKEPGDLEGPFVLAVAAEKEDAKLVVVSSAGFAEDRVAFARSFAMTSQGITVRSRNPGNITLLINSLHWLNDNTQFMNIGKPIDEAVLEIEDESAVKAFTILGLPALALASGGMVWLKRRR